MPDSPDPSIDPFAEFRPDPHTLGSAGRIRRAAASSLSKLLRFAFYLLYHQLAFTYDEVAWIVSAGEWADWRRCIIPHLLPGPVLEIAHGTGTLSLDLSDRGFAVTAIDLSPAMSRIARAKIRARQRKASGRPDGFAHQPGLVRADVQHLPFPDSCFASATTTFPADFLFQMETMRAVHRALRPAGRWIILPTAYPEWLAKRWLADAETASAGVLWHAVRKRLGECGFRVQIVIIRRPRSRVLLILAEKP